MAPAPDFFHALEVVQVCATAGRPRDQRAAQLQAQIGGLKIIGQVVEVASRPFLGLSVVVCHCARAGRG